ncbi:MAG: Gfo/Idh/MocA family oxidoreductase [Flavobacteriales bacterium]
MDPSTLPKGPILVVGLGSMGKRRLRNLTALGITELNGLDPRPDRRDEVSALFGIAVHADLQAAVGTARPVALVISVPPHLHHLYMLEAIAMGIPFFIEASVIEGGLAEINAMARAGGVFAAPSATMLFHPAVRIVRDVLASGDLGHVSSVQHHVGNYLPDWHPYEAVSDFYVSRKDTGGAREIVPFELTWLTHLFGFPERVCGVHRKTIDIPGAPDIDDTYNAILDNGVFAINLLVDVVARHPMRRLFVNCSEGSILWDWDDGHVRLFRAATGKWEEVPYTMSPASAGYNKNISDDMYIEEMRAFLQGIARPGSYVNDLDNDIRVLGLLHTIERAWEQRCWLEV